MIIDQPFQRRARDCAEIKAFKHSSFAQLLLVIIGDAAYGMNGQVLASIGSKIASEESAEIVDNQSAQRLKVEMLVDER